MTESEYNNMLENIHVRRNPETYNELLKAVDEFKVWQEKKRELINE
jgi:antitoxin YefM